MVFNTIFDLIITISVVAIIAFTSLLFTLKLEVNNWVINTYLFGVLIVFFAWTGADNETTIAKVIFLSFSLFSLAIWASNLYFVKISSGHLVSRIGGEIRLLS